MRKNNIWWIGIGWIALVLWCNGVYGAGRIENMTSSISVRWLEGGVSPSQLVKQEGYLKKDGVEGIPEVTLWEEIPYKEVNGDFERETTATVIELFGYMEDVYGDGMCLGGFPVKGDRKGCVISEQTAFELWGSRNVLGKTIQIDQGTYYVYGVVKGKDGLVMVQMDKASTRTFPNMQIRFLDGGYRGDAETFLKQTGFLMENPENVQFLDAPLLSWFLWVICFLPALLLGGWVLVGILRQGIGLWTFWRWLLIYTPVAVFLLGTLTFLMNHSLDAVPAHLIPTSWSNFSFFETLVEDSMEHVRLWLNHPTSKDVTLCLTVGSTIFSILVSIAFLVASISHIRIRNLKECWIGCFGCMGMVFLMAMKWIDYQGVKVNLGMWWMPSLWIMTEYGFTAFNKYIKSKQPIRVYQTKKEEKDVVSMDVNSNRLQGGAYD